MKQVIRKLRKVFAKFFVRRKYVITQMNSGVKYYYKGQDSKWTPMFEGAKHYKRKPTFDWISPISHNVEEYHT